MERQSHEKIVNFRLCNYCVHKNDPEDKEPCSDCLENPVNIDSQRPVHFKDNGSLEKAVLKRRVNNNE